MSPDLKTGLEIYRKEVKYDNKKKKGSKVNFCSIYLFSLLLLKFFSMILAQKERLREWK